MGDAAPSVLVLTPVKQAASHLDRYLENLRALRYPAERLSIGFLESDSTDGTYERLTELLPELRERYRRVTLVKHDFGFRLDNGVPRWSPVHQIPRRMVLARSRNRLLSAALRDEEWVLWLDVDVHAYPTDVVHRLLGSGKDIVTPHCVTSYGGQTFDWNAWRNNGETRMDSLRGRGLVRLDAVGGAMLLVWADLHRDGLIFPAFLYGRENAFARKPSPWTHDGVGEVETEAFGLMAKDMGHECWGMPDLEIVHLNE